MTRVRVPTEGLAAAGGAAAAAAGKSSPRAGPSMVADSRLPEQGTDPLLARMPGGDLGGVADRFQSGRKRDRFGIGVQRVG
jgi:hypothetical protein